MKTSYVKYLTCFALKPNERETIPVLEAHTRHDTHTRSTVVVVDVEPVLEGVYGWSQDYVVSDRVPLLVKKCCLMEVLNMSSRSFRLWPRSLSSTFRGRMWLRSTEKVLLKIL
ncbi:hypothetical protein JTB14_021663 [Gonioctena quinquepunctata]|nr:hypothetical protein JTB14_021663 [Gonioctena quinquepunctata]